MDKEKRERELKYMNNSQGIDSASSPTAKIPLFRSDKRLFSQRAET